MSERRQFWGVSAVAAAVLYAGAAVAQPTGSTPTVSDGVVKIGLILDMSGPYSQLTGKGSATAAEMAVEDFGGKVLGAPIQVIVADHHSSADQAAAIARDWYGDQHVDAIMDVSGSSEALIVQAIASTRDKIVMLNAPGANRLTNEGCTATSVHYTNDTYAIAHSLGRSIVSGGGDTWFFITVDYSYGYDLEDETAAVVTANGGTVLGHARHPLNAPDFTAYVLQARQSHAKVIGLANGGSDSTDTLKRAAALGMIPGPQLFAGLSLRINGVNDLGLKTAQGMMLAEFVLLGHRRRHARLVEALLRPRWPDAQFAAGGRVFIDDALSPGCRQSRHRRDRSGDAGDASRTDRRFLRPWRLHPRRWADGPRAAAIPGQDPGRIQISLGLLSDGHDHPGRPGIPAARPVEMPPGQAAAAIAD